MCPMNLAAPLALECMLGVLLHVIPHFSDPAAAQ